MAWKSCTRRHRAERIGMKLGAFLPLRKSVPKYSLAASSLHGDGEADRWRRCDACAAEGNRHALIHSYCSPRIDVTAAWGAGGATTSAATRTYRYSRSDCQQSEYRSQAAPACSEACEQDSHAN